MLWPVVAFLVVILGLTYRSKGPVWVIALSWLFCIMPIFSGALDYELFNTSAVWYSLTLLGLLCCYLGGCVLRSLVVVHVIPTPTPKDADRRFLFNLDVARGAWWIGLTGVICVIADFSFGGGAGLDDLAAIRDAVETRQGASTLAQIGSVLTWACLYCYLFAIVYRRRLKRATLLRFILPVAGYFLLSVVSAGRQAAFQVMLVTILGVIVNWDSRRSSPTRRGRGALQYAPAIAISAAMIGYMGYVAVARNDNSVSNDKGEVIERLFSVNLNPAFDYFISANGTDTRSATIEGLVYFSNSLPIFQRYLQTNMGSPSYGAMTFPFVFRQLQGLTGESPGTILEDKVNRLNNAGVIGAGWTTSLSAYMKDFGDIGGAFFLVILGYYTMHMWCIARTTTEFNDIVIAVVMLIVAAYSPLFPAESDTNILLLWLFALALRHWRRNAAVPA